MTNQLVDEASAYLRKHAHNPVNWYPWGEEAFKKARKEDKPLFISIGYFSCHWCSVMERESFEDEETANFMNDNFVNIKVDREERPDLDKIYQRYYTTLTGEGGGWPLNVYAFPDGLPFYIITYLPKNFSLRSRTFMSLNREIAESWENERDDLFDISLGLSRNLDSSNKIMIKSKGKLDDSIIINELTAINDKMDWKYGGILDGDTKFPRFSMLRFLLKEGTTRQSDHILRFVKLTYDKMSKGGIYDQLGGGIARYSVDRYWRIPHFEKMLYDQAGWLRFSAELYGVTKNEYIKLGIEDMLNFLEREMLSDTKAFYSSIDAESEGVEGAYYSFTHDEIKSILDPSYFGWYKNFKWLRLGLGKPDFTLNQDYQIAKLRYGIKKQGNFKDPHGHIIGGNILNIQRSINEISQKLNLEKQLVSERLSVINQKLRDYQGKREKPSTDKKIITTWNAMLITALLEVYEKTKIQEAKDLGLNALEFLLENHVKSDITVRSSHEDYPNSKPIRGILDDYVFLIETLIKAFEVTDEFNYIIKAVQCLDQLDEKFYSDQDNIYYLNEKEDDNEIGRILSAMDDSFQSAISVQLTNLYKLGSYLEREELVKRGQDILLRLAEPASEYKGSMSEYFISAGYYLRYPDEIVIINDENRNLDNVILQEYLPERLIYRWPRNDEAPYWEVVENRESRDKPTVFICKGATCTMPLENKENIIEALKE